jgi:hypothetical protein
MKTPPPETAFSLLLEGKMGEEVRNIKVNFKKHTSEVFYH